MGLTVVRVVMVNKFVSFLIVYAAIIIPLLVLVLVICFQSIRSAACTVLRVIARPLLLIAVVALVYDGTRTLAGGSGLVLTPLAEHWQAFHPQSLAGFKALLVRMHPMAWEAGGQRLVRLPAWIVAGALGLLLAWIGRKRRSPNVYIN